MQTKSGTQRLLRWIGNGLLALMLVWTLVPFYWMIATSLKKDREIYGYEATLVPRRPTFDAYRLLFVKTPFVKYVKNSTIIAVATTALSLVLGCLGAYALARLRFPGRGLIARGLVFTYLVPPSLLFIPLFAVMSAFRLIDTYHGLVLAYLGQHVLGVAAVHRVAGVPLLEAQRLPAGGAVLARAARPAQPGDGHAIALGHPGHPGADGLDQADALVAGDEGRGGLHGPVAVGGVDVRVAEARRLDPDDDLARAGDGDRDLFEDQRALEVVDDGRITIGGRTYRLRDSRVRFAPNDGLVPTVDAIGDTRIGDYDVTIRINGTPDRIETSFSSVPPLGERELQSLIVTGQTGEQSTQSQGRQSDDNFAAAAAANSSPTITARLASILGTSSSPESCGRFGSHSARFGSIPAMSDSSLCQLSSSRRRMSSKSLRRSGSASA